MSDFVVVEASEVCDASSDRLAFTGVDELTGDTSVKVSEVFEVLGD